MSRASQHYCANMTNRECKIPESSFKVIHTTWRIIICSAETDQIQIGIGILYGTAILSASMRTALRMHSQRRLSLDDAFLLFACATPVLYRTIAPLYFLEELASGSLESQSIGTNVDAEVQRYKLLHVTYEALIWIAIFSVKFSFLAFFRHIVDRITNLLRHWKVVVVINIVACAFCVGFSFMTCPLTGYTASRLSLPHSMRSFRTDVVCNLVQCAYGREITRETAIAWAATALDRVTDVLSSNTHASKFRNGLADCWAVVSIPARVLWHVRIRPAQKLGSCVFLSLSIVMIVISCIRFIGFILLFHAYSWYLFWLQVEGSVAVIMVSLNAFRSVFTSQGLEGRKRKARPWYSSTVAKLRRHRALPVPYNLDDLPAIPSATISGMRTFIRDGWLGGRPETNDGLNVYGSAELLGDQILSA